MHPNTFEFASLIYSKRYEHGQGFFATFKTLLGPDGPGSTVTEQEQDPDVFLAEALGSLAHPARLAILRQLRTPRVLSEIHVESRGPGGAKRAISRQAVREHLDKLLAIGAAIGRDAERGGRSTQEYVVNHQKLWMLGEEFRGLARLRPALELEGETVVASTPAASYALQGPCLVLVKGLEEGRVFSLSGTPSDGPSWIIGRRREAAISLDFDPFVSHENTRVLRDGNTFFVEDLPASRNGTRLNFRPLPRGGRQPLASGNLIGAGRSILLFLE